MRDTSTNTVTAGAVLLARAGRGACALRWDAANACWRWSDAAAAGQAGQLHAWSAPGGAPVSLRLREGACALAACNSGRVLLAQGKRLGLVEAPASDHGRALLPQVLVTVDAAEPRTAISSGCTDRAGYFVFGTANLADDQRAIGSFYQYSQRHGLRRLALPTVVRAAGIAVSADGDRLYFGDGADGTILHCAYDAERAQVGRAEMFAAAPASAGGTALADGAGRLLHVQGGALVHYEADGTVLRRLVLAGEAIATAAFGGDGSLLLLGVDGGLYGLPDQRDGTGVADAPFDDS